MDLCPGGKVRVYTDTPEGYNWTDADRGIRPSNTKRIRLTCPICKRRLMSSVSLTHEADDVMHTIPPHKPKKWWKLNKRRKIRR